VKFRNLIGQLSPLIFELWIAWTYCFKLYYRTICSTQCKLLVFLFEIKKSNKSGFLKIEID